MKQPSVSEYLESIERYKSGNDRAAAQIIQKNFARDWPEVAYAIALAETTAPKPAAKPAQEEGPPQILCTETFRRLADIRAHARSLTLAGPKITRRPAGYYRKK
jgi:hypothetical protein